MFVFRYLRVFKCYAILVLSASQKNYVYHITSTMSETCSEYILMIYTMMEINSWMARYRGMSMVPYIL